jgi:hypothetical protein
MSTNSQEPVRRADGMIELTREQSDQLLRVPIDLARAEAETMIAKGVSPDIAFRHLEAGYQKSYEARARIAAGANAQQQPAPPAPPAPAATTPSSPEHPAAPATDPPTPKAPLAGHGSPPVHEIPLTQASDESLGSFWTRRGAAIHQARQGAGSGITDMTLPFGLKAARR